MGAELRRIVRPPSPAPTAQASLEPRTGPVELDAVPVSWSETGQLYGDRRGRAGSGPRPTGTQLTGHVHEMPRPVQRWARDQDERCPKPASAIALCICLQIPYCVIPPPTIVRASPAQA